MHPVGVVVAFLLLWSLAAIGVFLILHGIRGPRAGGRTAFQTMVRVMAVLLGVVMICTGAYAAFVVLWGG